MIRPLSRAGLELLLGADHDAALLHAVRADGAVRRAAGVVHQHHRPRGALDAAAGDEDRVERRGRAPAVLVRVAVPAARGVAADAAAAADPGDPLVVLVDVVRVVRVAVVAPQVDRLVGHLGAVRVREVRDPDRPAVADVARERERRRLTRAEDRAEPHQLGVPDRRVAAAARRAAGPDVLAVLDAARRVARGQLDEVADLPQVRRVGVGDDVEAGLAAGELDAAVRRAGRRVELGVPRIQRADDQLAPACRAPCPRSASSRSRPARVAGRSRAARGSSGRGRRTS